MAQEFILGIDPGFGGAIAILDAKSGKLVSVYDMPLKESRDRNEIDLEILYAILAPAGYGKTKLCIIEQVGASPGAGVTGMFRFGEGYGILRGMLTSMRIPTMPILPRVWKKSFGLSSDKEESFTAVEQLFSKEVRDTKCPLKKHHGRAEAMILALYGFKYFQATGHNGL